MADASRTLQVIIQAKDEASKVISSFSASFTNLAKDAAVGSAAILGGLSLVGKNAIEAAQGFQEARLAFNTMIGDGQKAATLMQQLSDLALKSAFTLPQVVQGGKQLIAYGFSTEEVTKRLEQMGNVAYGVKAPLDDIVYLFGTLNAQGRAYTRDIIQFTQRGIPMWDELAKVMHRPVNEIQDLVTEGKVGFKEVSQALENMTAKGGKFYKAMSQPTLALTISNISDAFTRLGAAFMGVTITGEIIKGGLFDKIQQAADALLPVLMSLVPQVTAFMQSFLSNTPAVTAAIGAFIGLLVPLAIALWAVVAPALVFIAVGLAIGAAIGLLIAYWPQISAFFMGIITSIQAAILWLTTFATVTIPAFIMGIVTWFQQLPALVGAMIYDFFVNQLPFAIGYFIGYVYTAIPTMVNAFISFMQQLPPRLLAIMMQVYTYITTKLAEAWAWINKEVSQWPGKIEGFLSTIPTLVGTILDNLKKAFTDKLGEIWSVVMGWKDKVVGAFNAVVDAISRAISALQRGISAGAAAGKNISFQHGGFVPGSYNQPVPAILHGGERVIPRTGVDVNHGSGTGGGVTINFSGPVSMDSEERVNDLAERITSMLGRQNELAAKGVGF